MDKKDLSIIRSDYFSALGDFGIKHDDAIKTSQNNNDLITKKLDNVYPSESEIHGQGLFAERDIKKGELICIARKGSNRTIAGKYTNHHPTPNGIFLYNSGNIGLVALYDIKKDEELTVDYRNALSLQIQRPEKINSMVSENKDISVLTTGRVYLSGADAAAYDLFLSDDHINNLSVRERVLAFEHVLECLPQADIPVIHDFCDGLYRREITFKKGTFATGKVHKFDSMDVVLSGEIVLADKDGFKHVKGPYTIISKGGGKKAGYAITDVTFCTYHATNKTTVKEVEKELFMDNCYEIDIKEAI